MIVQAIRIEHTAFFRLEYVNPLIICSNHLSLSNHHLTEIGTFRLAKCFPFFGD